MTIGFLLLISVIITLILYYIIFYRPAKRRAERAARHRGYLHRRAELERNNNDFNNCYYDTLLFWIFDGGKKLWIMKLYVKM